MLSQQIKISKRWAESISNNQFECIKILSVDGITKHVFKTEDSYRKVLISEEDSWFVVLTYTKFDEIPPGLIKEPELLAELNQRLLTGNFFIKDKRDAESREKNKYIIFKTYQRCFGNDEEVDDLINQHSLEHERIFNQVLSVISENKVRSKLKLLDELFEAIEKDQNNP